MRRMALLLPVVLVAALALAAGAAEEKAAKDEAKTEAKKDTPAPAPKELTTVKGLLSASEGRTTLKVKSEEKSTPNKTYVLWPDADTAKTLAELAKKKAEAEVTGQLAPDGVNMKVSSVSEVKDKKKK